jgi:excisionase family DNA binding protein
VKITVSRPVNGRNGGGNEYIIGENGKELYFSTVREAVNYLADHNYTLQDLRMLNFNLGRGKADAKAPGGRQWLNGKETAEYAGISRTTFYAWIREDRVPFRSHSIAYRIRRFDRADIDKWLESIGREPGTGPVYPRKRKRKEEPMTKSPM